MKDSYKGKILKLLVESYRKSKKDRNENRILRKTMVKPGKIYRGYDRNDGDYETIRYIEEAAAELEQEGFLLVERENFGTKIIKLILRDDQIEMVEAYLIANHGYAPRNQYLDRLEQIIMEYKDRSGICAKECEKLSSRLEMKQYPSNLEKLPDIFKAVAFLEQNTRPMYVREASCEIYGDSKYLEENTLSSVCTMLKQYAEIRDEDEMIADEILEKYHIYRDTPNLCIKGNAVLVFNGKKMDISGLGKGVEFASSDLKDLEHIQIASKRFLTVENKTSYLRYQTEDAVVFYLGGFADRNQRNFLIKVIAENPNLIYQHFGDIDAGGFRIHANLCEITGKAFQMFHMSEAELQNPEYKSCLLPLNENDRAALQTLKMDSRYASVVSYMLKQGIKLEQEIVSLRMMQK